MWIVGQIPIISVSVKYVEPEKQDAPSLFCILTLMQMIQFCIFFFVFCNQLYKLKILKVIFLNLIHQMKQRKDYFILPGWIQISNVGSLLDYAIVLSTGRKKVLNLLSAQIPYCWTIVARLCYIRSMANVSNLKCNAKVMNWNCSGVWRLFIILSSSSLCHRNGVEIIFCSAKCDWFENRILHGQFTST